MEFAPLKIQSEIQPQFPKEKYCGMVEKAKEYIREGDIFQVVLSNPMRAKAQGSLFDTYRVLRASNPSPYMFYFSSDDIEIAGASPEILVSLKNKKFSTFPLAGTRPRGKSREMEPKALILSPGPGRPKDAGICIQAIRYFAGKIPILGVCLGHQAICEAFGGTVSYAKELMHGKQKMIHQTGKNKLFEGMESSFPAARYHSLAALKETLPPELKVTAQSEDGEVMAVEHSEYPVYGLQFHPESVMTPDGRKMIENFMK